jgi:hypothetical protein
MTISKDSRDNTPAARELESDVVRFDCSLLSLWLEGSVKEPTPSCLTSSGGVVPMRIDALRVIQIGVPTLAGFGVIPRTVRTAGRPFPAPDLTGPR